MGCEAREIWEQIGNENWGTTAFMNGYFNQRYMFYFDVHYGKHVRSSLRLLCLVAMLVSSWAGNAQAATARMQSASTVTNTAQQQSGANAGGEERGLSQKAL